MHFRDHAEPARLRHPWRTMCAKVWVYLSTAGNNEQSALTNVTSLVFMSLSQGDSAYGVVLKYENLQNGRLVPVKTPKKGTLPSKKMVHFLLPELLLSPNGPASFSSLPQRRGGLKIRSSSVDGYTKRAP